MSWLEVGCMLFLTPLELAASKVMSSPKPKSQVGLRLNLLVRGHMKANEHARI